MNIDELLLILRKGPHNLYRKLSEDLIKIYGFTLTDKFADYIYVNNNHPICLVAHIDTVERDKKLKLEIDRNIITAKDSVLGADDRAGVFGIMEILRICKLKSIPYPSILFTNYEEKGCLGAKEFCKSKQFIKDNVRLFVELDRKGSNDYVCYRYDCPTEVAYYIETFGFIKSNGSCSDVGELTEEYKIPHVNLSIGYYSQHTKLERLHIDEMILTINRILQIVQDPIDKLYEVKPKETPVYRHNVWNNDYDDYYGNSYNRNYSKPKVGIYNNYDKSKKAKIYVLDRKKGELVEYVEPTILLPESTTVDVDWADKVFN